MKVQQFQQRNLLLHGPWKWLVAEFASYFGVSDAYTKLRYCIIVLFGITLNFIFTFAYTHLFLLLYLFRYLSYVMDVATPTADCLDLVHDLLLPVVIKGKSKNTLSHQEVNIRDRISF